MTYLQCSARDCGLKLDAHDRALACPRCGDLLEVVVEPESLDPDHWKSLWRERRTSWHPHNTSGVWRFREALPTYHTEIVTLGEGNIPLVEGRKTASWAGVEHLWFKHLGFNPTGSFKDLGMTAWHDGMRGFSALPPLLARRPEIRPRHWLHTPRAAE